MVHDNYAIDLRRTAPHEVTELCVGIRENEYPWFMRAVSFVLVLLLVGMPYAHVYADEGMSIPETEASVPLDSEVVSEEVVPEPEVVVETEVSPAQDVSDVVPEPQSENATTTDPSAEHASEQDPGSEPEPEPEPVPDVIEIESEVEPVLEVVDSTVETEDVISPVTPELQFRLESDSQYVFQDSECTIVDDGAYYCFKKSAPDSVDTGRAVEPDEVYVAQDGDGDTEIYLRVGGVVRKITDNLFDDDAPVFDQRSGRIVWHANTKGRYQIFMYDLERGVVQLTNEAYNSQSPSIDGDTVVWQAWTDENWEVYRGDLSGGVSELTVTRLSQTGGHDMFPKVYGTFVTWQAREGDQWRSKGMNLTTGEFTDLGEGTGGDVQSTRLVLLVERRNDAGDVERVGYDIDTGDAISLGSRSEAPLEPETLPSPYEDPSAIPPAQSASSTAPRDDTAPADPDVAA